MEGLDFETHELVEPAKWQILGIFGLIIQGVLGIMSFLALLVKRYFENPKRTWTVWGLDTSKQVFSALLAHWMNMALAILLSQEGGEAHDGNSEFGSSKSDNWDWYFINIAVDVFLGVFLCYLILISIEKVASYYEIYSLNTGIYIQEAKITVEAEHYDPEKQTEIEEIDYKIWVLQMAVWGIIVVIVKKLSCMPYSYTLLVSSKQSLQYWLDGWIFTRISSSCWLWLSYHSFWTQFSFGSRIESWKQTRRKILFSIDLDDISGVSPKDLLEAIK